MDQTPNNQNIFGQTVASPDISIDLDKQNQKFVDRDAQRKASKREKIALLKKHFEKDIVGFAEFCFPNHCSKSIPGFHKDLYRRYMNFDLKRIAIAAPRGHAKSTVTDLIFLAWVIAYQKAHFIFIISNTLKQAVLQLETLKSEIAKNDTFQMLYGQLKTDKWAQEEIELKGDIKIIARGSGQQIRGLKYLKYRPDLVILDDLEDDEMVMSKDRREALKRWLHSEIEPALDVEHGRIIYIGTILHHDSLLNQALDWIDWDRSKYKAIQDDDTALWPEHMSREQLEEKKEYYINTGSGHLFYSEYQNEPRDSEDQFFKREDWRYYDEKELDGKLLSTFTAVDLAISRSRSADYSVFVTVSVDGAGNYYIREIKRGRWSPGEIIDNFFLVLDRFSPYKIGVEDGIEWQTILPQVEEQMQKRHRFLPIEELKHGGQSKKESPTRIRGLDPLYKSHKLFHLKDDPLTRALEDELYMFPSGKHDDIIDALAYILHISSIPGEESHEYEDNNFTAYGTF